MSQEDIHETPSSTPNFRTELAEQLAELVPEAIADGKVDVTKLQELLEEDAADGNERFGLLARKETSTPSCARTDHSDAQA